MSQYLTVPELLAGPLGISWRNIPSPGSTGPSGVTNAQNYQQVLDVINKASGIVDQYCFQTLQATLDSEEYMTDSPNCGVDNEGYLWVHTDYWPIISMQSFQYGYPAVGGTIWQTVSLSDLIIENKNIVLYPGFFQKRNVPRRRVQYSYLNGYAVALLTATAASGQPNLTLSDLTGFIPNQRIQIYDLGNTETAVVASTFVPATGVGGVLPLSTNLKFTHTPISQGTLNTPQYDIMVTNLPSDVKQATMLICKFLAEYRGASAVVMAGASRGISHLAAAMADEIPLEAKRILDIYKRIY